MIKQPENGSVVVFESTINGNQYRYAAIRIGTWYITNARWEIDRSFTWEEILRMAGENPLWERVPKAVLTTP